MQFSNVLISPIVRKTKALASIRLDGKEIVASIAGREEWSGASVPASQDSQVSTHLTKESASPARVLFPGHGNGFDATRDFGISTRRGERMRSELWSESIGTSAKHKSEPMFVSSDARHIFPTFASGPVIADATTQLLSYATTCERCSGQTIFGTNRIMFSLTRASGTRTEENGNKFFSVSRFHASAAALAFFHVSLRTFPLQRRSDAAADAIYVRPTLTSHLKVEEISRR